MKKLKIGLIVDSIYSSKYTYDLVEWSKDQDNLVISHLVLQKVEKIRSSSILVRGYRFLLKMGLFQVISLVIWKLLGRIEATRIKMTAHKNHLDTYDLSSMVPSSLVMIPYISKSGFFHTFSNEDIEKLREEKFDLLIRCGSGILKGEILKVARLGVISFHHGDNRINRGGPAGFWEVFYGWSKSGFIIQKLTEELDGGDVLIRGFFPTKNYFLINQANLYHKSNFYMKKLLLEIASTLTLPFPEDKFPYSKRLFKVPNASEQIKYIFNLSSRSLLARFQNNFLRKYQRWSVAFSRTDWKNLVMRKGVKIQNPPNQFLADPFVISEKGRDYCFLEDYSYSSQRGSISVYELQEESAERLGYAIKESFHLSFPFLFRFDSKLYMIPESNESKEIRLYECIDFPLKWELSKVIMSNVSAADSMVFERDGVWWMLTNIDPAKIGDHNSELYIFYSDSPLSNSWVPHPKNPIYIDPDKSRNGGILFDGEDIYRVSQKMGFQQYGESSAINKITCINKTQYKEELVCNIEASFFKNLKGTHHLHSNGGVTVYDYIELTSLQ
jgi:methionyl-tRNA formyltransferase